jgi:hypothetical protein
MNKALLLALLALVACSDAPGDSGARDDGNPIPDAANADGGSFGDANDPPQPPVSNGLFPADRVVPWQGNVGVEGGIPARTNVVNCVTVHGVPTNGTSDARAAIQKCLDATPEEGVAFLPAGTYVISGTLKVPTKRTLRGAGSGANGGTTIVTSAKIDNLLWIGAGYTNNGPLLPITAGAKKGSTSLTLADASSLAVGDYILVNEKNDPTIPVTAESYADGPCTWCDQFGATRLRAQVVRIDAKAGNTITLAIPFFYDFSPANDPRVMKLNRFVERAGIEDLIVKNTPGIPPSWNNNVMFQGAANSWMKNVKVSNCGKRCVDMRTYYFRLEVRDSLIEGCLDHSNSDTCYGTEMAEGSSSLVENNVYHDTSNGPIVMWGASGNVIAYNYEEAVFRTFQQDSWFWPSTWTHGAHPSYNLWEGNDAAGLNWDGYWGSASHDMAFRNRFSSFDQAAGLKPGHVECAAIIVETNNHYQSIVGNVLGRDGWTTKYEEEATRYWEDNLIFAVGTGGNGDPKVRSTLFRHRNYDYASKSTKTCGVGGEPPCQGSDASENLPHSLYLGAKPAWFGSATFPPFDPVGPVVSDIPAKRRFQGK